MSRALRQVVAFGGGGFSMEAGNPLLWEGSQVVERPIEPRLLGVTGGGAFPEPVSITEFREAAQLRSRSSRNSLRSSPPV